MLITKEIEIDTAHRVPNHKSKCRTFHGHRYRIEVGVDDKVVDTQGCSDEGMVIDYADLKKIMMDSLDTPYDHNGVFYINDPKRNTIMELYNGCPKNPIFINCIPTAENLAKHWYGELEKKLKEKNIKIHHVKVWETPTSTAIYTLEDKIKEYKNKEQQGVIFP